MKPIEKHLQEAVIRTFLPLAMLQVLKNQPTHGLDLLKTLSSTGVKSGSFYKNLSELRWSGMIYETHTASPKTNRGIIVYTITQEGKEFLKRNQEFIEECLKNIKKIHP